MRCSMQGLRPVRAPDNTEFTMRFFRNISILLTILATNAYSNSSEPFRMTVKNVQSMRGFVLNGLGLGGIVEKGCIANHDVFVVKRDGKVVYEDYASIMSLDGYEGFEAGAGHKAEFYLRGAADGAVVEGDVMEAKHTTCGKSEQPKDKSSSD